VAAKTKAPQAVLAFPFQLRASVDEDLVTGKVEEMAPACSLSFGRTKGDVLGQKSQELSSQIRLRGFDKI
jgi:hypothetical protein